MMCSRSTLSRALIFAALVLLALNVWNPSARADDTSAARSDSVFKRGTRALQFEVSSADLGAFNGAMFSGKYHLSDASAIRYGIGIGASTSDSKVESGSSDRDGRGESLDWETALHYVYYSNPRASLKPYWVIGPQAKFSWWKSHEEIESFSGAYEVEQRTRNWTAAMSLGFGLEWLPAKRFGLSGEYRSSLYYSLRESDNRVRDFGSGEPWRTQGYSKYASFGFRQDGVRFGLSVYF